MDGGSKCSWSTEKRCAWSFVETVCHLATEARSRSVSDRTRRSPALRCLSCARRSRLTNRCCFCGSRVAILDASGAVEACTWSSTALERSAMPEASAVPNEAAHALEPSVSTQRLLSSFDPLENENHDLSGSGWQKHDTGVGGSERHHRDAWLDGH